jgi:hypothetical protein
MEGPMVHGRAHRVYTLRAYLFVAGVIALFPRWRTLSLSECGGLQGTPFGGMLGSVQQPVFLSSGAPLWCILRRLRSC